MMEYNNNGMNTHHQQHQQQHGDDSSSNAAFRNYLMLEEKGGDNSSINLKRSADQQHQRHHNTHQDNLVDAGRANKRSKSDFQGVQQGLGQPLALHHSNGQQGNMFQSEMQRAQAFAQQQTDQLSAMNNSNFGSRTANHMERRLEEEVARQQQSAMLANEMARMNQQMNGGMGSNGMNQIGGTSSNEQGYGSAGGGMSSQRQLYDNNVDFLNNAGSLGNMQDLQNMQGFSQLSGMGNLSGMLDFSLLNNRISQQGLGGFGGGNGLPNGNSGGSMNQAQMVAMSQANQQMGHLQPSNSNGSSSHVNSMSSLNASEVLQLSRINASSSGGPAPQQSLSMDPSPMGGLGGSQSSDVFSQQLQLAPMSQIEGGNFPVLPPLEEAQTLHYSQRVYSPFSIEEDPNWLSNFQCFIRSEILELFRVSTQGIKVRNALKSLTVNQVGIRCRFCAHLQHGTRANRASCFPSKIDKIYQSFTMMLREHFPSCSEIPDATKKRFTQLQNMNAQGASNAKGYWEHAAKKKGLVDISEENGRGGIHIFDATIANTAAISPFGATPSFSEPQPPVILVYKIDKGLVSNFLFSLMDQTYRVHLAPSERKGNRKSLRPGMPGFGCRFCYDAGRMGLSRLFPARRRTIHTKVPDLFDHMKRCPLCPQQIKSNLVRLHAEENGGITGPDQDTATRGREREFFERIWTRLGHQEDAE